MQSGLSKNHAHIKQHSTDSTGFTYLFVYLYIYVTIMKRKVMTLIRSKDENTELNTGRKEDEEMM